jgi:L-iditol 2-dehydrogenase
MIQSKGIVLRGGKRVEVVTEAVEMPVGTQVLVKTHAVGVCGSDLALYDGSYGGPKSYPIYFGHEWSGTVEAVGPQVTQVKPGDKITGDCSIFCNNCRFCPQDKNLCQIIQKFGITTNGASRQYFLQDEKYIYRADPQADLDLVALSEPLAVGAHAVHRIRALRSKLTHSSSLSQYKQEKILILGGGTIGLACLFSLKYIEGYDCVELYDLVESRVEKAIELGAAPPTAAATSQTSTESYDGLYSGQGYDVIFETSGSPAAFRHALDLVQPLGTIMAIGFIPSVEFNMKTITFKAANIMGSIGGTGQFEDVLDFALSHAGIARQLITHQLPFEDVHKAFEIASDRKDSMKVLINF